MSDNENAMDYPQHEATYSLFLGMVKWGIGIIVVILLLMALFLL